MSQSHSWKPNHLSQRQEVKACAELLLELAKKTLFSCGTDGNLMVERLHELHSHSKRFNLDETYHPLLDLKNYFNTTTIFYAEKSYQNNSISLERALALLNANGNQQSSSPLLKAVIDHVREEMKPAGLLYSKLKEVCQHQ